ncbi:MAG: hypothetical protein J0L55_00390 [Caulobacterales bacterium]|nr:hypothetical protein [Caulobacterales bacterium]MCA0372061.1 hypothetical protein [Pseudomonadota bacterium]
MKKKSFFEWLQEHGQAIQSLTSVLTVLLALGALVGVKIQVDAAKKLQIEQSARDIYREYLALSINQPQYAKPNYCEIIDSPQEAAYENYVEYLIYTAEQGIKADKDWIPVFETELAKHSQYICSIKDWENLSPDINFLIANVKNKTCAGVKPCAQ